MNDRKWFYVMAGKQVGPVPEAELSRLIAQGALDAGTLVWAEGFPDWVPASSVPGLVTASPNEVPPPIPPSFPEIGELLGAGFWIRALARGVDTIFGLVVGFIGGIIGGIVLFILQTRGTIPAGWEHRLQGVSFAIFGLSLLGGVLYHAFSEGIYGASLGKVVCQLRVLQQDGQPSNMKGALIRNFGWLIDGLFFGAVGWNSMVKSPLRQRYGDVWGKTIVIKAKDIPACSKRSLIRFLGGFFLGVAGWVLLLALGIVLKGH